MRSASRYSAKFYCAARSTCSLSSPAAALPRATSAADQTSVCARRCDKICSASSARRLGGMMRHSTLANNTVTLTWKNPFSLVYSQGIDNAGCVLSRSLRSTLAWLESSSALGLPRERHPPPTVGPASRPATERATDSNNMNTELAPGAYAQQTAAPQIQRCSDSAGDHRARGRPRFAESARRRCRRSMQAFTPGPRLASISYLSDLLFNAQS
jgi:hypothetical protein